MSVVGTLLHGLQSMLVAIIEAEAVQDTRNGAAERELRFVENMIGNRLGWPNHEDDGCASSAVEFMLSKYDAAQEELRIASRELNKLRGEIATVQTDLGAAQQIAHNYRNAFEERKAKMEAMEAKLKELEVKP